MPRKATLAIARKAATARRAGGAQGGGAQGGNGAQAGGAQGGGAQGGNGAQGGGAQGGISAGGNAQISDTANWPMPNAAGLGLPNSASYDDTSTPGIVHDLVTHLDWPKNPGVMRYSQADAASYCDALSLGGSNDWHLPSFMELVSLFDIVPTLDAAQTQNYIAPVFQASGAYWSTDNASSNSQLARMVDFGGAGCGDGGSTCSIGVSGDPKMALGGAFCVRNDAPPPATPRFQVATDHVTDTRTGLVWLVLPAASQNGASIDAFLSCTAPGNGARVPSINELLTILTPSLDATAFPGWPADKFAWSSSAIAGMPGSFWAGGTSGASEASAGTDMNHVQCVR